MSTDWPHGMTQVAFYPDDRLKPPLGAEVAGTSYSDSRCIAMVKNVEGRVATYAYVATAIQATAAAEWMLDICNARLP